MGLWVLSFLLLLLLLTGPWWPYSRSWGYWPGGVVAAVLIAWVALLWVGVVTVQSPWTDPAVGVRPTNEDRSVAPAAAPPTP